MVWPQSHLGPPRTNCSGRSHRPLLTLGATCHHYISGFVQYSESLPVRPSCRAEGSGRSPQPAWATSRRSRPESACSSEPPAHPFRLHQGVFVSLVLANATVIDGTGADPAAGSVAITGSVI